VLTAFANVALQPGEVQDVMLRLDIRALVNDAEARSA
jgi:hypothetical protein